MIASSSKRLSASQNPAEQIHSKGPVEPNSLGIARQGSTGGGDKSVGRRSGGGSFGGGSQLSSKLSQSLQKALFSSGGKNSQTSNKIQDLL